MKNYRRFPIPYFIWSFIIIIIPLILIVFYAFTVEGNTTTIFGFSLENFKRVFEPEFIKVFLKTLRLGVITTAICLVLGYPIAYIISKCKEKTQDLLILLVTVPTWINILLRTYAWMNILSDNGLINNLLKFLGMDPVTMMYTDFSVILGMVCNFLPFMILPIHTALHKMDKSYIEAAMDLGATPVTTFRKIVLKLSMPGVVSGTVMVFILAISAFIIPKLLGGGQYMLIGNLIETQFISVGDWNLGSAISLILAIFILFAIRIMKRQDRKVGKQRRKA